MNLDNFLNRLWNLHNLLNGLYHRYGLFDHDLHYFRNVLDVVDHLPCVSVLNCFSNLFLDDLDLYNLRYSDYLLNDFFNNLLDLHNSLNNPFNGHDLLLDHLDFLDLWDSVVHDLLDNRWLVHVHDLLSDDLNLHGFGDFNHSFNDFLHDFGHLDNSFHNLLNQNRLLNHVVDDLHDVNGNVHHLLDFLDFGHLNNLLSDLLDWHHLRHLDHSVDYLLHNLFDFNDLRNHSEDLQNVVHVHDAHDLLVDHADNTLVDLQNSPGSSFEFFQLFKQCLDQDSQMELDLS